MFVKVKQKNGKQVKAKVINVNGSFADIIINGNKYLIDNTFNVII